jgi:CRP-like cAMP-binding protein
MLARYSLTPDGRRQFTALLLPGDVVGLEALFNLRIPDNAVALSATIIQPLSPADLQHPGTRQMLWDALERQTDRAGDWMLNLGGRPAAARLAYFFHDTLTRMRALGIGSGEHHQLPLTQVELADFLALTPVHVNRCLAILRASGLAVFYRGRLQVPDPVRLSRIQAGKLRKAVGRREDDIAKCVERATAPWLEPDLGCRHEPCERRADHPEWVCLPL